MKLTLIVAADLNDCIGRDCYIPWKIPSDLKRFKSLTRGHACIMGYKTLESILARNGQALPDRRSYVLTTKDRAYVPDVRFVADANAATEMIALNLRSTDNSEVFVIGGAQIYAAFLPQVSKILLTRVHTRVKGDTFMPQNWLGGFMQVEATAPIQNEGDEFPFSYTTYDRFRRTS
jgi:dihydrofolate reductase